MDTGQLISDLTDVVVTKKGACLFGDDDASAFTDDVGDAVLADFTLTEI